MRYIIKVTIEEGKNKGKTYIQIKGGYIVNPDCDFSGEDMTYATYKTAKSVCSRLYNTNEFNINNERIINAHRVANGFEPMTIYVHKTFEPYPVEV